jgi:hypothetical protein
MGITMEDSEATKKTFGHDGRRIPVSIDGFCNKPTIPGKTVPWANKK